MALDAGGMPCIFPINIAHPFRIVPPGVLSVLPGSGKTVGSRIVKNALIRKVDMTVKYSPITGKVFFI